MRTLHVGLRVTDPERSVAFYGTLGYVVVGHVPETGLGALTMLKLPDDEFVSLELVHRAGQDDVSPSGFSHLVVTVDDVHALADRLRAAGIVVDAPSSPDGSDDFWTAWVTDPDGYHVELVQWPAGHPVGMTPVDLAATGGAPAGDEEDPRHE